MESTLIHETYDNMSIIMTSVVELVQSDNNFPLNTTNIIK